MEIDFDCIPCIFSQVLEASRMVSDDEEVIREILKHDDSLLAALLMSAMGNFIDAGASLEVDLERDINSVVESEFKYNDYHQFEEKLANSRNVLLIADNAGEAVF